ncbi:hypothetical protein [Marinobacter salicampi]|uniref:hypothetical protein n=1 Tax=Marinobacter salicampi TaxID=435907 RepID=UPI00140C8076|nr:hypothetical protein [Marinobacter salicampi]
MNKAFVNILFAILASAFLATNTAWGWEKNVTVDYALGDADSRITAREAAYEALKVEAARSAKTYVQTTQTLKNDELSESIEVLGASMIKLQGVQEAFDGAKSRNGILTVAGTAVIDEGELKARVAQLQGSSEKAGSMKALTAENKRLRQRLEDLRLDLQSKRISAQQIPSVLEQQNKAREELEVVTRKINSVFEKGTLLEMASSSESELQSIKDELTDSVLSVIQNADYQVSIEDVRQTGDAYTVLVDLRWNLPETALSTALGKYLKTTKSYNYLEIGSNENTDNRGPGKHSEALIGWLRNHEIVAQVSVAGVTVAIPILYVQRSFFNRCTDSASQAGSNVNTPHFEICIPLKPGSMVYGNGRDPMPLRLPMTQQQAASATGVDLDIIMREPTPRALGVGQ